MQVQNIAFNKVVQVIWTAGNSWTNPQTIEAAWKSGPDGSGFELWSFAGNASGATQFYIRYTVSGTTYYDPGNNVNYNVVGVNPGSPAPTAPSPAPTDGPLPAAVNLPPIVPLSVPSEAPATPPAACGTWNGADSCPSGNVYDMQPSAERRRWQTPPRGDPAYASPSFQDYSDLVGYADIQYNAARTKAMVTVNAASKTGEALSYDFGGTVQSSPAFSVSSATTGSGTLAITVTSAGGKKLVLEPLNFIWQNVALSGNQSDFAGGQKGAIVELFGWPYNDVAKECEFLSKAGS